MTTFCIGLVILFAGGAIYGRFCEKVFNPDENRPTPAYEKHDGVDYVPIKKWKNSLIDLLSIAGTGPILGPIQGILFGPIAFITIPIGCVIGGAVHDYFCGMVSLREGGMQMPALVSKFTGKPVAAAYKIVFCVLMLSATTVFTYTPGDLIVSQFVKSENAGSGAIWIAYGLIVSYYLLATMLPIDKIIGRIYPIFAAIMIVSTVGILFGIFIKGYPLLNLWDDLGSGLLFSYSDYFAANHFVPMFFITVVCGILSGIHSTQTSIVSRTLENEKDGRMVFYNMMIAEGLIAMIWSAAAMGVYNLGLQEPNPSLATVAIGVICKDIFGGFFGSIAIIGVVVLPITSGDTILRSLRLAVEETLHINTERKIVRLALTAVLVGIVICELIFAKSSPNGFAIIWRYNSWLNQLLALFAVACVCAWMSRHGMKRFLWVPLVSGTFYAFVTASFIFNAGFGLNLGWTASYVLAAVFSVLYLFATLRNAKRFENGLQVAG